MAISKKRELTKDDGFHRVLVRGGNPKKDGYSTLYVKDVTTMLRKQDGFCGKGVIMLCLE